MIRKTAIILIVLLSFNKSHSQIFKELLESESDFKELKNQLKDKGNSLQNIENAFLNWDYKLLKPLLDKEIRKDSKDFFKTHHDSIVKNNWQKKTHYGPTFSGIPGGSFGLIDKSNNLRLHTTNQNNKVFEISYSYYVKDSTLHIYSLRSSKYPFKDRLNTTTPNVLKTNELTQSLRKSLLDKNTKEIRKLLTAIEKLEPKLSELPFFNLTSFNTQLSNNYGNLSWYLIFEKKYKEAVNSAEKGLNIDKEQTWIYTNLALSNLLAGNKEVAMTIYDKFKNQSTSNKKSFKEVFKSDLKEAKEAKLLNLELYNEILEKLNQ